MKKKSKIILNLVVVMLLLATGAQFYTNYKINQSLQQFPYYVGDKWVVYAEQTQQNFFSRQLVFSLQSPAQRAKGEKSEIINTSLTALPFAIFAKSELPQAVIRQLNEKLNITIDENIIHSRFSVVGNYLQSTMETKFRDFTNVNQLLKTELNFASKTKFVEIHTDLTGFNYDSVTAFGALNADYLLQPVSEHRYDLLDAQLSLAKLKWVSGENDKFLLDNIRYVFNKSFNDKAYDLKSELTYDKLDYNDKKLTLQGFNANIQQQAVPKSWDLYEKIKQLDNKNATAEEIIRLGLEYLFDNQQSQWNIKFNKLAIQQNQQNSLELDNMNLGVNINQQDPQNAEIHSQLSVGSVNNQIIPLSITGFKLENKITNLNLHDHLLMIKHYLFDENGYLRLPHDSPFAAKDNPAFIKDLQALAENYRAKTHYILNIDNLAFGNQALLTHLAINYHDEIDQQDKLLANLSASLGKLQMKSANISLNQLQLDLPLLIGPISELYPLYYCFNNIFALTCANNISQPTSEDFISQALAKFYANINDAKLSLALDTLPKSAGDQWIHFGVNAAVESIPDKKRADLLTLGDKLENSEISVQVKIATKLIDDMFAPEPSETAQLKLDSPYWQNLAYLIKPYGILNPYFVLDNEYYTAEYYQKGEKVLINRQPLEQYLHQQSH